MTVFKTFLKILNKNKITVIIYSVMLIAFGSMNFQTNNNATSFVASKPDVLIINHDEYVGITKNLIEYMSKNSNIKEIKQDQYSIHDALFYRDINYIIYIPDNYRTDFLIGKNPAIEVKSTGDYQSSYAEMLLNRYLKTATIYEKNSDNEDEIISSINETLAQQAEVEITSKLDTNQLTRVAFYYNFANYSILAGSIFIICLILSSFKEENVKKRTVVSSMEIKRYNRILLFSNLLFVLFMWLFYVILSFILLGNVMLSTHGLFYMLNSFMFSLCSLTLAFLIGNLVVNKNTISGIVNVIALGSSFLCGSFVPLAWLPDYVIKIAHIIPSYWYIKNNELLKIAEAFNYETLKPIMINMIVLVLFSIFFVIITNMISRMKLRKK